MNKSYSKLRHTNNINYLLEQRYLSEKRKSNFGLLLEETNPATKVREYCNKISGGEVDKTALAIFTQNTQGRGYMSGPNYGATLKAIERLTPKNLCATMKQYKNDTGKDLIDGFMDYIYFQTSETEILTKLANKIPNQISLLPGETQATATFPQEYNCVSKNQNAKRIVENGLVRYEINNVLYFSNGKYKNWETGEYKDYYCAADGTIKHGVKPQDNTQNTEDAYDKAVKLNDKIQSITANNPGISREDAEKQAKKELGYTDTTGGDTTTTTDSGTFGTAYSNTFTPAVLSAIRAKTQSGESGQTLTQKDVNSLYDLISKLP